MFHATVSPAALNGWDGASFRDQKGRICRHDGRIIRVLSPAGLLNWRAFAGNPLCQELTAEGFLIPTRDLPDGVSGVTTAPALEHEPIEFISYAFEWPFRLLQRAASLHLHLLQRLIPEGFILADASPSNVMFRGVRPVFIDVGSISTYRRGDVWQGFKQFLETMFYPLLLAAYKGVPYQAWLRGAGEDGLAVSQVAPLFGWRDLWRPGILGHVKLNAMLERIALAGFDFSRAELRTAGVPTAVLLRNIGKLQRVLASLRPGKMAPSGQRWVEYDADKSYGADARDRKRLAVETLLARYESRLGIVWDVGCNTGEYSFQLARNARLVIAMDDDAAVADELCRRCLDRQVVNVLPLVIDLANPSPAQGWRGLERSALRDRGTPDLIVAMGLLHHLVLTKNLPIEQVLAELTGWSRRVLLEYIDPEDPMARRLRRNVGEGRNALADRGTFEALARQHGRLDRIAALNETRTLYLLES